ncbi:unnamed protein product, partial [Urochloa humidicola]
SLRPTISAPLRSSTETKEKTNDETAPMKNLTTRPIFWGSFFPATPPDLAPPVPARLLVSEQDGRRPVCSSFDPARATAT